MEEIALANSVLEAEKYMPLINYPDIKPVKFKGPNEPVEEEKEAP